MDKASDKRQAIILYIISAVLITAGIAMIFFTLSDIAKKDEIKSSFIPVEAVVDHSEYHQRSLKPHDVYISYTVKDQEYTNIHLSTFDLTYMTGRHITVYYDPDDPSHVISDAQSPITTLELVMCAILIAGGFAVMAAGGRQTKSRADRKLEERFRPHEQYSDSAKNDPAMTMQTYQSPENESINSNDDMNMHY